MEINLKAPAIAQQEIIIHASLETIWQIITDIDHWQIWHPNISEVKLAGALQPGSTFKWKSGGTIILSTLQEVKPQRRISWTGKAIGTQAIHVWSLEPQENGSVLARNEESFEGWLVSLFRGKMQQMLNTSLQEWLELLKQKAEATS